MLTRRSQNTSKPKAATSTSRPSSFSQTIAASRPAPGCSFIGVPSRSADRRMSAARWIEARLAGRPTWAYETLDEVEWAMAERFERHRQPWKSDEIQKLHTLAKKGMPLKAIAKAMTRSEESIKERAKL